MQSNARPTTVTGTGAFLADTRTSGLHLICDPPSRFSISTACLPTRTSRESTGFPVFLTFKKICSVLSTFYSRVFRHFTIGFSHALQELQLYCQQELHCLPNWRWK